MTAVTLNAPLKRESHTVSAYSDQPYIPLSVFKTGEIVYTPSVREEYAENKQFSRFLHRAMMSFAMADFGEVCGIDKKQNGGCYCGFYQNADEDLSVYAVTEATGEYTYVFFQHEAAQVLENIRP